MAASSGKDSTFEGTAITTQLLLYLVSNGSVLVLLIRKNVLARELLSTNGFLIVGWFLNEIRPASFEERRTHAKSQNVSTTTREREIYLTPMPFWDMTIKFLKIVWAFL
jgi:hypothetical protein